MQENTGGRLARIGAKDAARAEHHAREKELARQRRGTKGSKTWGYATHGTGKRSGR